MEESIIHYSNCPVCNASLFKPMLHAKDYTVSSKAFAIWQCSDCNLRFTQDVPSADAIGPYYQSTDYISHSDSRKGFINRIYHVVRKFTLAGKRKLILASTGLRNGKLLDIGAGTGIFVQHMQLNGWQTTGLEPDEATRKRAAALHKVNLLPAEELFSLPAEAFDVITMWHVLEHVHELHAYIEQLKKLLKSGGRIFIAVPNYTSYDAVVYNEYWAAYDVPRHLYHFCPDAIRQLLAIHGLHLESIKPMWFDSFYISFLSEQYKKGNKLSGFFVALRSNLKALANKERCSSLIYIISKS